MKIKLKIKLKEKNKFKSIIHNFDTLVQNINSRFNKKEPIKNTVIVL